MMAQRGKRADVTDDPHAHDCPRCADGGMVAPYEARNGIPVSWICLSWRHDGARRFVRP